MVISVWVGTWWRSLDNKPTYRLILKATWSIWCFQVRFWSIKIPRYFTDSLRSRETYLFLSLSNIVIFGWKVSFLWAGQNMTKLVFLIFKVSLFAVSQSHNLRSSRFTMSSSDLRLLSAYRIFVSSANKKKLKLFRIFLDIVNINEKKQWTQGRTLCNTKRLRYCVLFEIRKRNKSK